jgi:hypothetical protein
MKKFAAALALVCALAAAATAAAATVGAGRSAATTADTAGIAYGVADDTGKFADDGGAWFNSMLKGANLTEERWTVSWNPSDPTAIAELPFLKRSAPQAQTDGVHVVLALYGRPASAHDAAGFCSWAGTVAGTVQQWGIHDFIVWNEPNTQLYWAPQDSSAPAAYEALLAKCYDAIHAADAQAKVIGFGLSPRSNGPTQTAPIPFLKGVGAAYRASGRQAPIMDQMSVHPYPNPNSPTDGPQVGYPLTDNYGIPNLDRVKQAIYDAFNGTKQPTTLNGLTFRIDELGWQSDTSKYPQYYHAENVKVVSEQQQADDIRQTVQKYFACDPTVTDVEWFLLVDEPTRDGKDQSGNFIGGGWQSGFLTAGGKGVSTPKLAYTQDAPLFAQGRAACTGAQISWSPSTSSTGSKGKPTAKKPKPKKKPKGH